MQKLTLIGHLGGDATLKTGTTNGEQFLSFTLAVSDNYTDKQGVKVERTTWYDCINKKVNLAPYLKKGGKVYIEGRPSYGTYEDKNKAMQISIKCAVSVLELLDRKPENAG